MFKGTLQKADDINCLVFRFIIFYIYLLLFVVGGRSLSPTCFTLS
uniref:Uncharacterized protein n=1 Tax=Nelumbo nucifera TaxID=4432 RepID=A0A822YPM3_NELNU|nr:TPA_asm: hypothetical protein HUJ06_006764 [Nelumbo nucifera]